MGDGMLRRIMAKIILHFLKHFQNRANRIVASTAQVQKSLETNLKGPKKIKGPIKRLRRDVTLLFEVSRAWLKGEYKRIPFGSITLIVGALLYFLSPFDAIPDFIPFAGFIDDAFVFGLTLNQIRADLRVFEQWKINRPEIADKNKLNR